MFDMKILILIFAGFLGTYLTRILAYVLFKNKKPGYYFSFIQKNMPLIIIVILFFYTFYGVDFTHFPYGLNLILACIFVFLLHIKFKNMLLSVILGTIFYMLLLRTLE